MFFCRCFSSCALVSGSSATVSVQDEPSWMTQSFVGFVAGVDCGPYCVVLIFICVIVCCQCAVRSNLFVGFGGGVIGNFGKEGSQGWVKILRRAEWKWSGFYQRFTVIWWLESGDGSLVALFWWNHKTLEWQHSETSGCILFINWQLSFSKLHKRPRWMNLLLRRVFLASSFTASK